MNSSSKNSTLSNDKSLFNFESSNKALTHLTKDRPKRIKTKQPTRLNGVQEEDVSIANRPKVLDNIFKSPSQTKVVRRTSSKALSASFRYGYIAAAAADSDLVTIKTCPQCTYDCDQVSQSCPICEYNYMDENNETTTTIKICPQCTVECDSRLNYCHICDYYFSKNKK